MAPRDSFHPRPDHRSDIDGLRALAVMLVLLFHLGTPHLEGGFVGVDVFFVISGYLIGGILIREIDDNTFTFARFYGRRIRRIFPALLAVLLVTTALAYRYLFPPDLLDYAHLLVAALFSVSNLYLLQSQSYFDVANRFRPLLHTWSLGIEEQYYLVFPLVLIAIRRWLPAKRGLIVWGLAILSLAAACAEMQLARLAFQKSAAFFFSPLRAWELLLGTMIYDLPLIAKRWTREAMAALGLLLIVVPAIAYTATTSFPGLGALPPCLGAALLLHVGRNGPSLTGKALSIKPIAFIGLISYSLYLIHWPLIVFQQQTQFLLNENRHPGSVKPLLFLLSLSLATLCWRFIETPFREGGFRATRGLLYTAAAMAFGILLVVGLALDGSAGWRVPGLPATRVAARYASFHTWGMEGLFGPGMCFVGDHELAQFTPSTCLTEDTARDNFLLFGDSHAMVMYPGLKKVFPKANIAMATMIGCIPLATPSPWVSKDCNALNQLVFQDFVLHHPTEHVLLAGRWGLQSEADLAETVAYLKAHRIAVSVLGPGIEFDASLPSLISIADRQQSPAIYSNRMDKGQQALDRHFATLARTSWHVPYISIFEDLCGDDPAHPQAAWQVRTTNGCPIFAAPNIPLLYDGHHLTSAGAAMFVSAMRDRHQLPWPEMQIAGQAGAVYPVVRPLR